MSRYLVFLRAVNVGGHAPIRMDELCHHLEMAGFDQVSAYRQSGNISFRSSMTDIGTIRRMVFDVLERMTGVRIEVYLFTLDGIRHLSRSNPFTGLMIAGDRVFATFMSNSPSVLPELPLLLGGHGIKVIGLIDDVAFSLVPENVGSGPLNELLERRFCLSATTRSWVTVEGLLEKFAEE